MNDNIQKYLDAHKNDVNEYFNKQKRDVRYRQAFREEQSKMASAIAVFEARQDAHLSQASLAKAAGIPTTTLARIEQGNNTSVTTLMKIASALNKEITISFK